MSPVCLSEWTRFDLKVKSKLACESIHGLRNFCSFHPGLAWLWGLCWAQLQSCMETRKNKRRILGANFSCVKPVGLLKQLLQNYSITVQTSISPARAPLWLLSLQNEPTIPACLERNQIDSSGLYLTKLASEWIREYCLLGGINNQSCGSSKSGSRSERSIWTTPLIGYLPFSNSGSR